MNVNAFWHFLTLQLFKERAKHFGIIFISVMILFLLASILFISSSIRFSLEETLEAQPDFVVSRLQGGTAVPAPLEWGDELVEIYGITKVTPRVYGRYFFAPKDRSFLIVGVDFLDEQTHKKLQKLKNDNIQLRTIGRKERVPKTLMETIEAVIEQTKNNTGLIVNLAFNYGARLEIIDAVGLMDGEGGIDGMNGFQVLSSYCHDYSFRGNSGGLLLKTPAGIVFIPHPDLKIR